MKKYFNLQTFIIFLVEVAIPIIFVPLLPQIFSDWSNIDAIIVSICISIFIALWNLDYKFYGKFNNLETEEMKIKKELNNIIQQINSMETFYTYQKYIENISHPYFKKQINIALEKNFDIFMKNNHNLFNGYIETDPYENITFGIEGLKLTKKSILAVSSINDYWERDSFIKEYLFTQYNLIKNRKIEIKRIFIIKKDNFKKMRKVMSLQKSYGIEVYYIDTSSKYFNKAWENEDFLIQDKTLLVDLQCNSHKYEHIGKEIITINKRIVNDKIIIFEKMLGNATLFNK